MLCEVPLVVVSMNRDAIEVRVVVFLEMEIVVVAMCSWAGKVYVASGG